MNHITKEYVNLKDSLPKGDTEKYIDMSKYELIILNVYSKNNVGAEIVLVIECQRKETENNFIPVSFYLMSCIFQLVT